MPSTLSIPFVVKPKRQTATPLRFYVHNSLITPTLDDDLFLLTDHLNHVFSTTNLYLRYDFVERIFDDLEPYLSNPAERIDIWIRQGSRFDGGVRNNAVDITVPELNPNNHRLPALIAHEVEHICRVGEYNTSWTMRDFTGVPPLADVRDGTGSYWNKRQLAKRDPVTGSGGWDVTNIEQWRAHAQLCPLSSYLVNQFVAMGERFFTDERFDWPTNPFIVHVETEPGATVAMYGLQNTSMTQTQFVPMVQAVLHTGDMLFDWRGGEHIATQGNQARLFKAELNGRNGAEWLTVHDLHAAKVLGGGAEGDFHYHGALRIELN